MKKHILGGHLSLIFLFYCYVSHAQNFLLIHGRVFEKQTGEALPFATISLKKQLQGTLANESGNFDFLLPENASNDTLVVSYLGYKSFLIGVKNINTSLNIGLDQNTLELNEIVVKPQPPEFYIKLAILKAKYNYPKTAFESQAYYREKILENKNFIRRDEGVFKSYYSNFVDSADGQHQLLLYRKEENTSEIAFRSKERKDAEEKKQRKNEKRIKKGKSEKTKEKIDIEMVGEFSGPQSILEEGNIILHPDNFLDTLNFKKFDFAFEKSSSYDNNELMVINFKSKKKVEMTRESGKIYIDAASHAIVKIESAGDFIIPAIVKPFLLLYGIGIGDPTFEKKVEFQKINSFWYPKNIQSNIQIQLVNKHFFRKDEISNFDIESIYAVIKLNVDKPFSIPKTKRFVAEKEMEEQVYNDENLNWSKINIIKK